MDTNKCLVRKLKMSSTNENLPVFEDVVLKDYIKSTLDDQYIALPYRYPNNGLKVDVVFKALSTGQAYIISSASENYMSTNGTYVTPYMNGSRVDYFSIGTNTDINAGFDTSNGEVYVGSTTGTGTAPSSSISAAILRVFGRFNNAGYSGQAGKIAIKSVTITIGSDVHTLVPALVNNVAVLYDNATGETFGANTGNLAVE